jgi:hypothetical protein
MTSEANSREQLTSVNEGFSSSLRSENQSSSAVRETTSYWLTFREGEYLPLSNQTKDFLIGGIGGNIFDAHRAVQVLWTAHILKPEVGNITLEVRVEVPSGLDCPADRLLCPSTVQSPGSSRRLESAGRLCEFIGDLAGMVAGLRRVNLFG